MVYAVNSGLTAIFCNLHERTPIPHSVKLHAGYMLNPYVYGRGGRLAGGWRHLINNSSGNLLHINSLG